MKALCTIALWLFTSVVLAGGAVWIDVRTPQEYAQGHKEGAYDIPHTEIGARIGELKLAKDAEINLYCRSGRRASIALNTLESMGYTRVNNIGGLNDALHYEEGGAAERPAQ